MTHNTSLWHFKQLVPTHIRTAVHTWWCPAESCISGSLAAGPHLEEKGYPGVETRYPRSQSMLGSSHEHPPTALTPEGTNETLDKHTWASGAYRATAQEYMCSGTQSSITIVQTMNVDRNPSLNRYTPRNTNMTGDEIASLNVWSVAS